MLSGRGVYPLSVPTGRLHGDEESRFYSDAEELRLNRRTGELTAEFVSDPTWWNDRMEGVNALSGEVPGVLARCMGNLRQACGGERIGLDAITTALSQLERLARADAMVQARERAEVEMAEGTL